MNQQLQHLLNAGQSVWLDNLRRSMFASGELQRLIDSGLRGMTSNPTIFEKAIGTGDDYDAQLRSLIGTGSSADALFWDLAIADIESACDLFRPVFDASGGNDGFVSIEVSPLLAHDTQGTIAAAKHLWQRINRPNLMVKIPGTNEGVPAIEEAIYAGININVTLIFSIEMYEKTALAYIKGIERRIAEGKPIAAIRSVNSVFVSRIDTAIDKLVNERIAKGERLDHLLGKAGIANLKLTYAKFKELFHGDRFARARAAGATVQRPLWASTSTKNPKYPELMYVENVVARETVNTMPPQTLDALMDHGVIVPDTVESDLDNARAVMKALAEAKISVFDVMHQLQVEGVASFNDSFAALLGAIVYKQKQLCSNAERVSVSLGSLQAAFDGALDTLANADFLKRLRAKDTTLWSDDPAHAAIIKQSLGWLDIAQHLLEWSSNLKALAKDTAVEFTHAVVLGMGGSSLAPDVLRATLGTIEGYPRLHVLDSTDPDQIAGIEASIDIGRTLFIVASKSGTTTEPDAFYRYFYDKVAKKIGAHNAAAHFVAITDPGTALAVEAKSVGFRAVYENDPNIGGRYSALSFFGMLPAAIAGYDVNLLLDRGLGAMHANDKIVDVRTAPGTRFGAAIGACAKAGRDKLTIVTHPRIAAFGQWCEQLIAESTGKLGTGVIPIEGEPLGDPSVYGSDRVFVYVGAHLPASDPSTDSAIAALEAAGHPVIRLALNDAYDLGEQFYLWEIATAAAGALLHIDPFDQPNVQESKDNTKALLATFASTGALPQPRIGTRDDAFALALLSGSANARTSSPADALADVLAQIRSGDYVAITAYLDHNAAHERLLRDLRVKIRDARKVATTVGFGPRFLHSTGQLHKGGPDSIVTLQLVHEAAGDPMIPGMNVGFRTLIDAQSIGDFQALDSRKRRGLRIVISGALEAGLRRLGAIVDDALTAKT